MTDSFPTLQNGAQTERQRVKSDADLRDDQVLTTRGFRRVNWEDQNRAQTVMQGADRISDYKMENPRASNRTRMTRSSTMTSPWSVHQSAISEHELKNPRDRHPLTAASAMTSPLANHRRTSYELEYENLRDQHRLKAASAMTSPKATHHMTVSELEPDSTRDRILTAVSDMTSPKATNQPTISEFEPGNKRDLHRLKATSARTIPKATHRRAVSELEPDNTLDRNRLAVASAMTSPRASNLHASSNVLKSAGNTRKNSPSTLQPTQDRSLKYNLNSIQSKLTDLYDNQNNIEFAMKQYDTKFGRQYNF